MLVSVLEAKGSIWGGNAEQVTLPSEDGELVLLDFHQSLLCALMQGYIKIKPIRIYRQDSRFDEKSLIAILIRYGIARMRQNELVVMAERA